MTEIKIKRIQNSLECITRRWWFFVGLVALLLLPPFASKGYEFDATYEVVNHTLDRAVFFACKPVFPVFQIIAIAVAMLMVILRDKAHVLLGLHAGVSYVLCAVLQFTAVTPAHGLSILSSGVVMFGLVAATWFWEAVSRCNDLSPRGHSAWRYLVIPPAVFTFWFPLDWTTFGPDLAPAKFITSGSALTFCMLTPVYLAVLIFVYPRVNMVTLRLTSTVGLIIGLFNAPMLFGYGPRWNGLLHLPLLVFSALGLILSMRRMQVGSAGCGGHTEVS